MSKKIVAEELKYNLHYEKLFLFLEFEKSGVPSTKFDVRNSSAKIVLTATNSKPLTKETGWLN